MKTVSEKIATLFLICLISLTITGYTYSHWTDTLTIFGTINMGNLKIAIDDEKLIPDNGYSKTPDNKTITISAAITTGWQIWVGLVIENNGTLPVTITHEATATNDIQYKGYFQNETHFYGPYTTIPPEAWDDLNGTNPPPPSGEKTPPIDVPKGDRLVVWQKIWVNGTLPGDFISIIITSRHFATFHGWHDTVAVIYHLFKG